MAAALSAAAVAATVASPSRAATDTEAAAAAATVSQAASVPSGWTGTTLPCLVGTESAASLDATLRAVNAFRFVARLPAGALDATLNAKALEAAVMMRAGNEHTSDLGLSHAPGPTWPCFSLLGAAGAATSNLALGTSGADAIRAYVADDGVASLGHRRWILDPATTTFGSGSTGVTNALAVIGGAREPVSAGTQVPWPPAGAIAAAWVPLTWSVSVGGTGEPTTFDDPRVSMTVDGAAVAVSTVTDLGTSYGTGRTLAWTPAIDRSTLRFGYHRIAVSISGARAAGLPVLIDYATTIGTPPAAPAATPTPTPGPTARPTPTPTPALAGLRPRIAKPRGATTVGTRLSASFTHGTGRIVTKVQWLRSGAPIRGATSVRYRVTRTDRGRTLRVQITSQAKDGSAVLTEQSVGVRIPR